MTHRNTFDDQKIQANNNREVYVYRKTRAHINTQTHSFYFVIGRHGSTTSTERHTHTNKHTNCATIATN